MALITCKECKKEISDKARACPNCGCPVDMIDNQKVVEPIEKTQENDEKNDRIFLTVFIIVFSIITIAFVIASIFESNKFIDENKGVVKNVVDDYKDKKEFEKQERELKKDIYTILSE